MRTTIAACICLLILLVSCERRTAQTPNGNPAVISDVVFTSSDVVFTSDSPVPMDAIKASIQTRPGAPLDHATLNGDIKRLQTIGVFLDEIREGVGMSGNHILIMHVKEQVPKPGPIK